jgi:hypothetical protein
MARGNMGAHTARRDGQPASGAGSVEFVDRKASDDSPADPVTKPVVPGGKPGNRFTPRLNMTLFRTSPRWTLAMRPW